MVWDEHGIQVPFGEKIIGFRLKERGQISSCVPLWEQRNSFEDNEIPDAALSRPCAGLSGPKIAGVTGKVPYAEESFRTIEHESAAPRSFSTMGLLASSYAFQCRRNVVDGVIKRPFKCVFPAPGRRIPSLMHAILLCESEVILNCGIDIHSAIGDSHY